MTVNGLSVTEKDINDINLNVSTDTDNIPVDVINNVSGERYAMNISLDYEGEFGFTAVMTVNMEKKNAGLYANLFYYNETSGELEFMCADEIDDDGNADLEFSHASDYTIIIDKEPMDGTASEENTESAESTENGKSDESSADSVPAVAETESDGDIVVWILMIGAVVLLAGICAYLFFAAKKKEK